MPVKFYLSPQANKAGEFSIRVSIMVNGTRYLTTAEYKVAGDAWVDNLPADDKRRKKEKGEVLSLYTNSKGISGKMINNRLNKIRAHFSDYELNTKVKPSEGELKVEFQKAIGLPDEVVAATPVVKKVGLFVRLQEFIAEESKANQWAYATIQCWTTFTHHLTNFNSKVTFDFFNETGINKFVVYLRNKCGLEEKSVQKQFNNLRWFLYWPSERDTAMNSPSKLIDPSSRFWRNLSSF